VGLRARRLHAPRDAGRGRVRGAAGAGRGRANATGRADRRRGARAAGRTIACAGEAAAPPANAAWVDPRLFCAARLLATSVAAGQASGLVDAEGRTTTDRMSLAGFPEGAWAEGYAVRAETAPEAWSTMLGDDEFCSGAGDAALSSLGVGVSGEAYVVTRGAP